MNYSYCTVYFRSYSLMQSTSAYKTDIFVCQLELESLIKSSLGSAGDEVFKILGFLSNTGSLQPSAVWISLITVRVCDAVVASFC